MTGFGFGFGAGARAGAADAAVVFLPTSMVGRTSCASATGAPSARQRAKALIEPRLAARAE
jgi:hypothetical protein